jgi:hypothetical protein
MLRNYILTCNKKEFYFEGSCDKETLKEIIGHYKETVKKPTKNGLFRYLRQQGYRVNELISMDTEEAEAIENL